MAMRPLTPESTLVSRLGDQSPYFFVALGVGFEWLSEPVDTWEEIPAYQSFKAFAKDVPVDNAATERMIRRTYMYREYGRRKEENFQATLHLVGKAIEAVPKGNTKKALKKAYGE